MAMATMTSAYLRPRNACDFTALRSLPRRVQIYHGAGYSNLCYSATIYYSHRSSSTRSPSKQHLQCLVKPISAVGSGLETSITDPDENNIRLKNAKIVLESLAETKLQIRVDLTGEETRIVFEKVLMNLARTAPPVPGFRKQKGGKTSKVPKDFLLQIIGEERVTNFVIQEIVSSALADYAKKENLTVKDNRIHTIQTAEELRSSFIPGNEFGFSATLELENSTTETTSSSAAEFK